MKTIPALLVPLLALFLGVAAAQEPPPPDAAPRPRVVPLDIQGHQPAPELTPGETPEVRPAETKEKGPALKVVRLWAHRRDKRQFTALAAADRRPDGVVEVALNKARPVDLPEAARDVVVGNPAIADVVVRGPRQVFLVGRGLGATNVFFLSPEGHLLSRIEVQVGPDAENAQAAITRLLPDDDITVSMVGDALMLTGKVRDAQTVNTAKTVARRFVPADTNVVNQLVVVGTQQVMLRVRVAEMNRTLVKQLGVRTFLNIKSKQINTTLNGGNTTGVLPGGIGPGNSTYTFPTTGGTPATATTPGTPPTQAQAQFGSLPGTAGVFGGGGEYSTLASNNPGSWISVTPWNLLANYAALENEGLAKTLAEPNLTTVSGEVARFLAGGEVPIPTAGANGVVTVDWKQFGVGLVFSPVVLANGNINLKLESEVSAVDNSISVSTGSITVPGFKTRRATTVVELPSGGSLMIAGLLEEDSSNAIDAVPGLRDVPVLGALFGSSAFRRNETELVVTVDAYLVNPVDQKALALPTDGFIPAGDLKRYFLLHLQETYLGKNTDLTPTALKGPVGYIVE